MSSLIIFYNMLVILSRSVFMKARAFKAAFPYTIPIFAGFWFLALAYGILMNVNGFSFVYPMLMSLLIFGGSLEFIVVTMLLSPFAPMAALTITLLVQARHLFYGITMLERFKGMGWKKPYLIFGMCDESFSINFTAKIPGYIDKGWFFFWVTVLNHFYWFSGSTIGGILGSLIHFDTTGLDFVLTAMFVAIFTEQWLVETDHRSSIVGVVVSGLCLCIFGASEYIIPAMMVILTWLNRSSRVRRRPNSATRK